MKTDSNNEERYDFQKCAALTRGILTVPREKLEQKADAYDRKREKERRPD